MTEAVQSRTQSLKTTQKILELLMLSGISPSVSTNISGVEVTILDAALQLHTATGVLALSLTNDQSMQLRDALTSFEGFKVDSSESPVILGAVMGGTNRSSMCARPISGLLRADCQVDGVTLKLDGNRLMFEKHGARTFIQLLDQQIGQVQAELGDLRTV